MWLTFSWTHIGLTDFTYIIVLVPNYFYANSKGEIVRMCERVTKSKRKNERENEKPKPKPCDLRMSFRFLAATFVSRDENA